MRRIARYVWAGVGGGGSGCALSARRAVEHQADEAPPGIRGGGSHDPHHPGVRQQQQHDVFRDEIRAQGRPEPGRAGSVP